VQVTRLKCGSFIFAHRLNHTISDSSGLFKFLSALGEISCGMIEPSISPVWCRELLNARNPPRVTCTHHEYEKLPQNKGTIIPLDNMVHHTFFFGPTEVAAIRSLLPLHPLQQHTDFEIISAFCWRCRTIALQLDTDGEVRFICVVDGRSKSVNLQLPKGYYGNALANSVVLTTAGKLIENPLAYALNLVKKAKANVTQEYMHSLADLMVIKSRPHFNVVRSYLVSDVTRGGFEKVDYGWGKPVYGGPARGADGDIPGLAGFHIPFKNAKGEKGVVIPFYFSTQVMERFVKEMDSVLKSNTNQPTKGDKKSGIIVSSL